MSGLPMSWKIGAAVASVNPKRRNDGGIHWMPMAVISRGDFTAKASRAEGQPYLGYEEARDLAKSWARTLNKTYGEG